MCFLNLTKTLTDTLQILFFKYLIALFIFSICGSDTTLQNMFSRFLFKVPFKIKKKLFSFIEIMGNTAFLQQHTCYRYLF